MHNDSIRIFIKYNSKVPCLLGWHTIDQFGYDMFVGRAFQFGFYGKNLERPQNLSLI